MTVNKMTLHQHLRGRDLKSIERDVLQAMASYGDYSLTNIRPALETVARDYALNVKTVRASVKSLVAKGIMEVVKEGGGRCNPTVYCVVELAETFPSRGRVSEVAEGVETLPSGDGNPPLPRPKPSPSTPKTLPSHGREPVVNQSFTKEETKERTSDGSIEPPGFSEFFELYPKRVDRSKARTAYKKILAECEADPATLLACARDYRDRCGSEGTPDRYVCKPANWLRDGKWRDYKPAPRDWWPGDLSPDEVEHRAATRARETGW